MRIGATVLVCIACLDSMLSAGQVITNPCMHSSDENGSWMEVVGRGQLRASIASDAGTCRRLTGNAPPPPGTREVRGPRSLKTIYEPLI